MAEGEVCDWLFCCDCFAIERDLEIRNVWRSSLEFWSRGCVALSH